MDCFVDMRYPIVLRFVDDDGDKYYYAYLPDFGHSACSACGSTVEEALEVLEDVMNDVIRHYGETGKHIPSPGEYLDE